MSATFQPFGLKPVYHPSGLDRATAFVGTNSYTTGTTFTAPYSLSSGQSFWQYQPVAITSSGQLTIANQTAASGKVFGVFDGVEYTNSDGRRSVAKYASKLTLDAATQIVFWIFSDPALVYEAQINGSATTAAIGTEYNFDTTTGYTVADGYAIGVGGAGFSKTALLATAVASGAQGQVRVIGLGRETAFPAGQLNAWGDAYTIVQVQIANNTFAAASVSV
ncbi:hypothetical protein UFOVP118_84 [uncultured Caudovirales phage]|uniref:Uncharacterized protein n=1 Tax=uncultured Caudovirales phage TaxID=2100421 RepID=A0A6J5L502_9CAUD|nr:hypothetical protein UFOVP118_84 [uncultured Caudovirales phage]